MDKTTDAPLALDADGNALSLPEEAAGWRVKRQTGGRPRQVLGPDRTPLRLPLEATADDLADMLGPGAYRLEAVDEDGDALDCIATVTVGEDSDSAESPPGRSAAPGWPTPSRSSDLRASLDANVAMARTLSEAVRVLAEAQADWTKGLAVARAIPRNAKGNIAMLQTALAAPAPATAPAVAEAAEVETEEKAQEAGWVTGVASFVDTVGKENIPVLINMLPMMIGEVIDRIKKPRIVKVPATPASAPVGDARSANEEAA